jgi:hypothetical protein
MSDNLTPEQHELVTFIMAEGIKLERQRILDLINKEESDTIEKSKLAKMIDGE